MDAGDLKQSLANLEQVVENKPSLIQPYIMRSMIIAENGDSGRAEKDLLPLLQQFPDRSAQAATFRALAWVRINQKKYEEGRAFLERAEQVEPSSKETLYLLGFSYIQENEPDAALALLRARLRENPHWAEGYEVAGTLMLMASRYDVSEAFFRQAISQDPQPASAWQGLGDALLVQSKCDQALDAFGSALERSPQSADLYMRIAQVHDRRGEWNKAEEEYQKVLMVEPDNAVAKNNLAWDYAEHAGNMSLALRLAQEAANTDPDDPEIFDTLGWVYLRMNTPESAVRVLKESVAKGPKNAEYRYHLAIAYVKIGDKAEAKRYLQSALTLQSTFPQADDARKILLSLKN
jgi:tetratricopeptide (TPR) repeat protein